MAASTPIGTHSTERDGERQRRADERAEDAGELRLAAVAGGQEPPIEAPLDAALGLEPLEIGDGAVGRPAIGFRRHVGDDMPSARRGRIRRLQRQQHLAGDARGVELRHLHEPAVDRDQLGGKLRPQLLLAGEQVGSEVVRGRGDGDLARRAARRRGAARVLPPHDVGSPTLEVEVGVVGQQEPRRDGLADERGIGEHALLRRSSAAPVLRMSASSRRACRLSIPGTAA